tara:strand:- start:2888 stop:3616 length:729 start_codon:yes stop_codon:yes gene_type:complete
MALEGQHVVVTGAAQGIGECTARRLAERGCRLYLTDIQAEKVAGVATDLGAAHGPVDITEPERARAMINDAIVQLGHIDSLVNIAGIDGPDDDALEETEEHWRRIIDADLSGPWWVTRAVLPHMIERGRGRIVITSSITGVMGFSDFAPSYHAAKAGLIGLTNGLSARFEADGILINAIVPGYIGTGRPMSQTEIYTYNSQHALGMGGPQPVADAVCYLLDDSGNWISGTVMNVTGGLLRGQ